MALFFIADNKKTPRMILNVCQTDCLFQFSQEQSASNQLYLSLKLSSSSIILSGYPVRPIHFAMPSSLVCCSSESNVELFKFSAGMHQLYLPSVVHPCQEASLSVRQNTFFRFSDFSVSSTPLSPSYIHGQTAPSCLYTSMLLLSPVITTLLYVSVALCGLALKIALYF